MASNAREDLRQRVQRALFQESIFRWESAAVISLTLLLSIFGPNFIELIPGWAWLAGGVVAEAGLVYSSLTDPEFGRRVVAKMLRQEFKPERLQDKALQKRVTEALDYRSRIEAAIREQDDSLLKDDLAQTASQIDEWLEQIYDLARRIDRFRAQRTIVERDRRRAASRIQELQAGLAQESNPKVQSQMEDTLHGLQLQVTTLEKLENTNARAELQLENTLTHLGTIYSQTMLVDAKDIDSGRARRLRQEITDEVDELQDVLLAMDEVYSAQGSMQASA